MKGRGRRLPTMAPAFNDNNKDTLPTHTKWQATGPNSHSAACRHSNQLMASNVATWQRVNYFHRPTP